MAASNNIDIQDSIRVESCRPTCFHLPLNSGGLAIWSFPGGLLYNVGRPIAQIYIKSFEFELRQVNSLSSIFYLKIYFIHHNFRWYNVWIYPLSHSTKKTIRAPCYHYFYFDFPSLLLAYSLLAPPVRRPLNSLTQLILFSHTLPLFHCYLL